VKEEANPLLPFSPSFFFLLLNRNCTDSYIDLSSTIRTPARTRLPSSTYSRSLLLPPRDLDHPSKLLEYIVRLAIPSNIHSHPLP
jgi:hypothetical protein